MQFLALRRWFKPNFWFYVEWGGDKEHYDKCDMLFISTFLSFGISTDYNMCKYLPLVGKVLIR